VPPSKVTVPAVMPVSPAITDSEVDLPALQGRLNVAQGIVSGVIDTHPFDPNKTKIPVLGTSRLSPETAVTLPFEENIEVLYTLVRFRMEIEVFSGTGGA